MTGMAATRPDAPQAAPPVVDTAAPVLPATATMRDVLKLMAAERRAGIAIADVHGSYLGTCTLRGLAGSCLGVRGAASQAIPSFAFRHDDMAAARRRLAPELDAPAGANLDPQVPVLAMPVALSDALRHLHLGAPLVAVVEPQTRRFIGTIEPDAILAALNA
jgi:hypothetical protein